MLRRCLGDCRPKLEKSRPCEKSTGVEAQIADASPTPTRAAAGCSPRAPDEESDDYDDPLVAYFKPGELGRETGENLMGLIPSD